MIKLTDAVSRTALAVAAAGTLWSSAACADPLALFDTLFRPSTAYDEALRDRSPGAADAVSLHNRAPVIDDGTAGSADVPANLRRQVVAYPTTEPAGTIVIDTPHTYLYLVLGGGKAMRYGIGVGREGFTWSGVQAISRKQEWPDWIPPTEMLQRQPYLPRFMAGGPGNALGARAMYLGNTIYRIHGTNAPTTIGHQVSSGCIRMINEDVTDLYGRVNVGTKVVVLPMGSRQQPTTARMRSSPSASVVPASEPAAPATRTIVTSNSARAFGLY
jgi:lipoprotein-anchoring transpeptidase ErfK/SrfK